MYIEETLRPYSERDSFLRWRHRRVHIGLRELLPNLLDVDGARDLRDRGHRQAS